MQKKDGMELADWRGRDESGSAFRARHGFFRVSGATGGKERLPSSQAANGY
jgi:hypothetical protein